MARELVEVLDDGVSLVQDGRAFVSELTVDAKALGVKVKAGEFDASSWFIWIPNAIFLVMPADAFRSIEEVAEDIVSNFEGDGEEIRGIARRGGRESSKSGTGICSGCGH